MAFSRTASITALACVVTSVLVASPPKQAAKCCQDSCTRAVKSSALISVGRSPAR